VLFGCVHRATLREKSHATQIRLAGSMWPSGDLIKRLVVDVGSFQGTDHGDLPSNAVFALDIRGAEPANESTEKSSLASSSSSSSSFALTASSSARLSVSSSTTAASSSLDRGWSTDELFSKSSFDVSRLHFDDDKRVAFQKLHVGDLPGG